MLLSKDEVVKSISNYGWTYNDKKLSKTFTFKTYMEGLEFVNKIGSLSEKKNHHADIYIGWCEVKVYISSHDMGGVTTKCINLAMDISFIND